MRGSPVLLMQTVGIDAALELAIVDLKPPNIHTITYYLEGVSYVHIYSTLRLLHIRFLLLCRIGGSVII